MEKDCKKTACVCVVLSQSNKRINNNSQFSELLSIHKIASEVKFKQAKKSAKGIKKIVDK